MAVTLGSKVVGSIVKLKENGVLQNYIVVHQGLPSSMYDSSCNGTWLLRQDCIEMRAWDSEYDNNLENSDIQSWLNVTMIGKYNSNIQSTIKQVKIPYRKNGGPSGSDQTGANGLSCKIFLLSAREVGFTENERSDIPNDGTKLDYFISGNTSSAQQKRIAKLNGSAVLWWLRSPITANNNSPFNVNSSGSIYVDGAQNSYGIRPALILPLETLVDSNGIVGNAAPTVPPSITVPNIVIGGKTLNISWGASTDEQGDTMKYQLERSTNSGTSFTKIYDGTNLSYVDKINVSWSKVRYRVRAYDTLMAYSAYKASADKTVLNLTVATINVPNMAMRGQAIPISWSNATNADSYTLERLADSGSWQSIYTGANPTFTDTAGTWDTVQYRVKASNNGNFGTYKTSSAVPVVSTAALIISGTDSDLGTLINDISYTISTDTGNKITLERYVNGQLIAKISVNSGFNYTIPVIDLPTGTGTIRLVATVQTSSGSPVSKTRVWTYNKTPVTFANNGGIGALQQDGKNIFPPTLAECVRVPAVFGGSLDKALELIAPLLNIAVMAVGSYVGSGTFGKNSPNSLTFNFTPQMVIISGGNKNLTISNTLKTDGGTVGYIEGTKVTWYNNTSADEQLNQSQTTYTYIAVGKQV